MELVREHGQLRRQGADDRAGEGATVFDAAARPYLDALASLWYCNVGHGRAELADAAAAQMRQLAGYQTFDSFTEQEIERIAETFADALDAIAGS